MDIKTIPDFLYRGDSDHSGIREIRETINFSVLKTNLVSAGIGKEIFQHPLDILVKNHIKSCWNKTHFLSFTTDKLTAIKYGKNGNNNEVYEYYGSTEEWDFLLLKITKDRFAKITEIGNGVFECYYKPILKEFSDFYRILLINSFQFLIDNGNKNESEYSEALANAKRDCEWLLLPATQKLFNNGQIEYSGILDTNCFKDITKYSFI